MSSINLIMYFQNILKKLKTVFKIIYYIFITIFQYTNGLFVTVTGAYN